MYYLEIQGLSRQAVKFKGFLILYEPWKTVINHGRVQLLIPNQWSYELKIVIERALLVKYTINTQPLNGCKTNRTDFLVSIAG